MIYQLWFEYLILNKEDIEEKERDIGERSRAFAVQIIRAKCKRILGRQLTHSQPVDRLGLSTHKHQNLLLVRASC
ncbi:hypothetical protein FGO68_gene1166 [Halteria grandinella]|uniref:Uncharacterized protein n=1 Tax=Halteria grandinella TaxID=5974 RepID=A0A8J8T2J9_HALGN|nr:hypothetical protein FGO68_gene1166 [Halteria grandinella]